MAAAANLDAEALLDVAQVLFHRTGEIREPRVVGAFEGNVERFDRDAQAVLRSRSTSRPRSEFGIASVMTTSVKRLNSVVGPVEIDPAAIFGAAGELTRVASCRTFDQHALHGADHAPADRARLFVQLRLQPLEACLLLGVRDVVGQRGGWRAGTLAVDETEALVETHLAHEGERALEIFFRLAGEADDEVGRQADVGSDFAQLAQFLLVLEHRVAALHQREHAVRAALHRQVQEIRELRHVAIRIDQAVAELDRMRGREADALDARNCRDEVDQRREVGMTTAGQRAAIRVHVLPEQRDLHDALLRPARAPRP